MERNWKPELNDSCNSVLAQHQLINKRQLKQLIPVSDMSIWRWEKQNLLPNHVVIGGRNFWRLSEVLNSIEQLKQNEDGGHKLSRSSGMGDCS